MMSKDTNLNKNTWQTFLSEPLTFLGGLLLFLMMFSPAYNVVLKIILIAILLISIIVSRIFFDKLNLTSEVLLWYVIFIFHGVFFTILGLANGNNKSFVFRSTTYNIWWPIIYLIFTIGLYKKTGIIFLIRVIVISNFFVCLYIIGSALTLFHLLPPLGVIKFDMSQLDWDTEAGLIKVDAPSLVSMMFTAPFIISLTLLTKKQAFGFKKWFLNLSILISIIAVVSSVRRALILNLFLAILLTYIFSWAAKPSNRSIVKRNLMRMLISSLIALPVVLIAIQQLGIIDLNLIFNKVSYIFQSKQETVDMSMATRYNQFGPLIKSWLQKPLLGHGHGAVSEFVVRSRTMPWIYELTYVALLFQVGIIGLLIYLALLGWPIYIGLKLTRKGNAETAVLIIPIIVGCTCFLIANGTNPYLQSYDYMWALFFPVAVVNYCMKEQ